MSFNEILTLFSPNFSCRFQQSDRNPFSRKSLDSKFNIRHYTAEANIDNFKIVVCFLLGDSPASEFYMPTFRNTLFHLHRQVGTYLPDYEDEDGTECSETSAYKIQTPGNHPKESIQHLGHGEKFEIKNFKISCRFELDTGPGTT